MQVKKELENLKIQIKCEIEKEYRTIEEFCFINNISKGILYRFFSGKRIINLTTLCRIVKALKKNLKIV